MKKELEQKLIKRYKYMFKEMDRSLELKRKYDKLFKDKDKAKSTQMRDKQMKIEPYYPIVFGFECDDGWYDLLDNLMGEIEKLDVNKTVQIHQIKEKFGGLKFYINEVPSDKTQIYYVIREAENRSYSICEICGKPGELCSTNAEWLKTVCKEHRELKTLNGLKQKYKPIAKFSKLEHLFLNYFLDH